MKLTNSKKTAIPILRFLAAVATGLMLAFSICKPGVWQLSWVALVPLISATYGQSPKVHAWLWGFAGLVYYGILLSWVALFGYEPWVLLVLIQALYFALFGLVGGLMHVRARGVAYAVGLSSLWAVLQWLRGLGVIGFTWGSFAHILSANPSAIRPALWSSLLLDWMSFLANAGLALLAVYIFTQGRGRSRSPIDAVLSLGLCAICLAFFHLSAAYIQSFQRNLQPNRPFSVALIQGSERQDVVVTLEYMQRIFSLYEGMSLNVNSPQPRLIIWPETTIPEDFVATGYEHWSQLLAIRTGANYIIGAYSPLDGNSGEQLRNSAYVIDGNGDTTGIYSKVQLVPFGEYVPFRDKLGPLLEKFDLRDWDVLPGQQHVAIDTQVGKVGILICFESLFDRFARREVKDGAQVLVVMTNDGWFEETQAAYQHLLFSRLRAVETGRYVLRAAATGISAIIGPDGCTVSQAGIFRRQTVEGTVYPQDFNTPNLAVEDVLPYIFILLSVLSFVCKRHVAG